MVLPCPEIRWLVMSTLPSSFRKYLNAWLMPRWTRAFASRIAWISTPDPSDAGCRMQKLPRHPAATGAAGCRTPSRPRDTLVRCAQNHAWSWSSYLCPDAEERTPATLPQAESPPPAGVRARVKAATQAQAGAPTGAAQKPVATMQVERHRRVVSLAAVALRSRPAATQASAEVPPRAA